MNIRISTDFLTGLLFVGLGAGAILIGSSYPIGSAARMGAGYFPLLISGLLVLLGAVLLVRSFLQEGETVGVIAPRPVLVLVGSMFLFGLVIEDLGFPIAGLALVIGARYAAPEERPFEAILLAIGLVVFCVFLFAWLLGLSLPHTRFW